MLDSIGSLFFESQAVIIAGLFSVTFAFLIWSVKESYKKHCDEVALLGKIEIIFAHNLGSLLINKSFFEEWLRAMQEPRLYDCSFRTYLFLDHEDYNVTNQELLNDLIKFDFSLRGFQKDLNLFFKGYHQSSLMLLPKNYVDEWQNLNKNILEQSEKFIISFTQAENDAKNCIALVRAYAKQKRYTPYGLVRTFLGKNLLPKISDETILKYRVEVDEDLKEKQSMEDKANAI